jgi:glycerophosphoryl diester phosphodiesterase
MIRRRIALLAAAVLTLTGGALAGQAIMGSPDSSPTRIEPTAALTGCPDVIVHRTGMGARPENTVVGIQWAATAGAKAVEMDVRWTRSDFPVLMHDPTVDRTTNGAGAVTGLYLSQATALRVDTMATYPDEHVPYGYDFMKAASTGNLDVVLDIMQVPTRVQMDKLAAYVNLFGWSGRTLFQANAATVKTMRAMYPNFTYVVIEGYSTLSAMTAAGEIRSGAYVRAQGGSAYTVLYLGVTASAIRYWHDNGLQVYTWTSDTATTDTSANWSKLAAAGVDGIITNRAPDLLAWETANCG